MGFFGATSLLRSLTPAHGRRGWRPSLAVALLLVVAPLPRASSAASGPNTWSSTGSMAIARAAQTATLLYNGQVLVAGGCCGVSGSYSSAELYNPSTGAFSATGSMATARESHTATLLQNGLVLIAGGSTVTCPPSASSCESSTTASAELYIPTKGAFVRIYPMATARYWHTATLLQNGQVLVAGGVDANGHALASAELYNPAANTWSATGSLIAARYNHTATLLPNGQVLVTGGHNDLGFLSSAELYNPATGTWIATGAMLNPRQYHTATLLHTGMVLVAGGCGSATSPFCLSGLSSAELYNPATGTFTSTGSLTTARAHQTATLLSSGQVLAAGGCGSLGYPQCATTLASAELYNPTTGTWAATGSMAVARYNHTATLLQNGQVLVAGGCCPTASAEEYTPALLSVQPGSGSFTQPITITGSDFAGGEQVALYMTGAAPSPLVTATASLSGTFVLTTTVPQAAYGAHTLIAMGATSGAIASAGFGITASVALSPTAGTVASSGLATGYGFAPQEQVAFYWDSTTGPLLGSTTANVLGTATVAFTVPLSATTGLHTIYGVGQTSHAIASSPFTVD